MTDKKNILIIGASSEIAQAIITNLKESGTYNIITTSRKGDGNFALDLNSDSSIAGFKKDIASTPLAWVFYSAGFIESSESSESFDGDYGLQSKKINFESARELLQTLIPQIETDGGIVCLSSTAGIWGNPNFPIYSTWKGALNIYLQSLSKKLRESGRYVFSICPGPTNTSMRQSLAGDAEKHQKPEVIASHITQIISNPDMYIESPILVIRENTLYKLDQTVVPL